MKKKKWIWIPVGLLAAVILFVIGAILYIRFVLPSVPLKEITVSPTPEMIERGNHLANHVLVCMDCHSTRDWKLYSGPVVDGTLGKGGEIFDEKMGFPGSFASPNITPFNLKNWSDSELYRAITSGVTRDGKAMFPIMPYPYYRTLDNEDIFSIIAYLRSIPEIESYPPASKPGFPMSIIINTIPEDAAPAPRPPKSDTLKYGEYLAKAAGCLECHTQAAHGQIMMEKAWSGGRSFEFPDGLLMSSNLTPDPETGIGNWTREAFINRFRAYDPAVNPPMQVGKGMIQTIMPWTMYAGMTDEELTAIHAYLMSLKPVSNKVVKFSPLR